jgi:hypothetical protein
MFSYPEVRATRRIRFPWQRPEHHQTGAWPYLVPEYADAADGGESARREAREDYEDARNHLLILLEDAIAARTWTLCPTADRLDVEIYKDSLGRPRGQLLAVRGVGDVVLDGQGDTVAARIGELLDDWASVADPDSVGIYLGTQPAPPALTPQP